MTAVTFTRSIYQWIIDSVYSFKDQANIFFFLQEFIPARWLSRALPKSNVRWRLLVSLEVHSQRSISSTVSVKLLPKYFFLIKLFHCPAKHAQFQVYHARDQHCSRSAAQLSDFLCLLVFRKRTLYANRECYSLQTRNYKTINVLLWNYFFC